MGEEAFETSIEGMTSAVKTLVGELKGLTNLLGNMPKNGGGYLGGNGGYGQRNYGTSGRSVLQDSLASVSSMDLLGVNKHKGDWLNFTGINAWRGIGQGAIEAATGVIAGGIQAMPDISSTTNMAKNYFTASLMSGGSSIGLGNYMTGAMKGAMTDPLGASRTAGILSGMGYARVGGMTASFNNAVTATANISKYLGVDNDTAAQAVGGMGTRSMSQNLLRNYGMFTTDPSTGKKNTVGQTISQLGDMFMNTAGSGKLSREDVLGSLQSGYLGANLEASGLDANQQSLVAQYMLAKSDGKKFDLDSAGGLSEAAGKNPNPYSAEMNVASSQAGAMNAATKAYIDGNNAAAAAIGKLQGVITAFIQSPVGQYASRVNAMVQTGMEDNAVQGAITAGKGILQGSVTAGEAMRDIPFVGNFLANATQGMAIAGTGQVAANIIDTGSKKGDWQNNTASAVSWGSGIAGFLKSIFGGGGEDSKISTGGTKDTTGAFKIIKPVPGASVTAGYNAVGGAHSSPHKGIDYGVSIGTKVLAAASGTVKRASGSTANTYGKKGVRSFGLAVVIDHGNGYTTTYAHLSSAQVSAGMAVTQGQVIALSGNSGYSTGAHLHFQVEKDGVPIDPNSVMGAGGVVITQGNSSSQQGYSGDTSTSSIIGEINTGQNVTSTPPGYSGASIAGGAAAALVGGGSQGNLGHGTTTVALGGNGGMGVGGGSEGAGLSSGGSGGGNHVTINVSVAQATRAEAEKLAVMVKEYLDDDRLLSNMGRR